MSREPMAPPSDPEKYGRKGNPPAKPMNIVKPPPPPPPPPPKITPPAQTPAK